MGKTNILFTGGGTLGHIYPLVSVVKELKYRGYGVFFIGTTTGLEKEFLEKIKIFDKTFYLDSEGIKRKFTLRNFLVVYKHLINTRKAKNIITEYNIDLVIGMGGYISASVVKAAFKLKVKSLIHEQNSVLGLANKINHKKVNKVLLNFNIGNIKNSVVVGNPRISEIYELYKENNNFNKGNYCLVVGGSRGAKRLNDLIISLKDQFVNSKIEVILITGKKYYKEYNDLINKVSEDGFKIIDFADDLPKLLIEAKVIVSRCGATTLAEIMALRKVSLLIPSPNVTDNHQEKNGKWFVKKDCGMMLLENNLTKESLFDKIYELYYNKNIRNRIINNIIFNTLVDAKEKFVEEIELVLKK